MRYCFCQVVILSLTETSAEGWCDTIPYGDQPTVSGGPCWAPSVMTSQHICHMGLSSLHSGPQPPLPTEGMTLKCLSSMSFIHSAYLLSNLPGTAINFSNESNASLKKPIHYLFNFQTDYNPNAVITATA